MEKDKKNFFLILGFLLLVSLISFAPGANWKNAIYLVFFGIFAIVLLLFLFFSPLIVYSWYRKRGGRKKWLIWPALIAPTVALLPFFGLLAEIGYFWMYSFLYIFFSPFASIAFYCLAGGRRLWLWGIILIFFSLVLKGLVSFTSGAIL